MVKNIITTVITAIVVSILALSFAPKAAPTLGSTIETVRVTFGQGFETDSRAATSTINALTVTGRTTVATTTIGSAGTPVATLLQGVFTPSSCTGSSTQPIGATVAYDCSVTGARLNDRVFITLASTTPTWVVLHDAYASTTVSNSVRVVLLNASSTGAFASATTTGIKYLIVR